VEGGREGGGRDKTLLEQHRLIFTLNSVLLVAERRPSRQYRISPSIADQPTHVYTCTTHMQHKQCN
jgi:hypothetical protein